MAGSPVLDSKIMSDGDSSVTIPPVFDKSTSREVFDRYEPVLDLISCPKRINYMWY